jgi:uncharacterized protein (DUF1330 family)
MPAFVIADIEVIDKERYERYKQLVPGTLEAFGGRFIARGGRVETLDGEWSPQRVVILEFPSVERAQAWMDSPEYAEAKAIRHATARSRIIAVEGL